MSDAARMLLAIADFDAMLADIPGVDAEWLVRTVAQVRAIDVGALALHLLRRTIARERARAELAAVSAADAALDSDPNARKSLSTFAREAQDAG